MKSTIAFLSGLLVIFSCNTESSRSYKEIKDEQEKAIAPLPPEPFSIEVLGYLNEPMLTDSENTVIVAKIRATDTFDLQFNSDSISVQTIKGEQVKIDWVIPIISSEKTAITWLLQEEAKNRRLGHVKQTVITKSGYSISSYPCSDSVYLRYLIPPDDGVIVGLTFSCPLHLMNNLKFPKRKERIVLTELTALESKDILSGEN